MVDLRCASFGLKVGLTIFCLVLLIEQLDLFEHHVSPFTANPVRKALVQKALKRNHYFASANDARINYIGRWLPSPNHIWKDASFPGARLSFTVINTTSVYLQLRNQPESAAQKRQTTEQDSEPHLAILPGLASTPPSKPCSLLTTLGINKTIHFGGNGYGMLSLLETEKATDTSISVSLLPSANSCTIELEGIWLSSGTGLQPSAASQPRIEIIRPSDNTVPVPFSYPSILATSLNATAHDLRILYCLTTTCNITTSLNSIFFRSGLPLTHQHNLPYTFSPPHPSALILELGLLDYLHFLSSSPNTYQITQYNHKFTEAYVTFIKNIRAYAYPHSSTSFGLDPDVSNPGLGLSIEYQASYAYNSLPSTLPIFLLTPFTANKRLRRILSHVIFTTAHKLQKDGDKSTFWVDSSNWLRTEDYLLLPTSLDVQSQNYATMIPEITSAGHEKIARYLSLNLCPYLKENGREECPFHTMDEYLGHLYVPEEAGVGRSLEDRKIKLVTEMLGWHIS